MARTALLNVMVNAVLKAGRGLARDFGEVENLQVSLKGPGDFVSAADRRSEETLIAELGKARPSYSFLANSPLETDDISAHLVANQRVGVPYTDEMVENAKADLLAQADPDADWSGVEMRYPKAKLGDFDGNPSALTEMDALVAYLQMLGTLVDFSTYDEVAGQR